MAAWKSPCGVINYLLLDEYAVQCVVVAVCFAWCDDLTFVFGMLTFSIKLYDVCFILEDKTLEATDQEIKLPKGRVVISVWVCVCELVRTYD